MGTHITSKRRGNGNIYVKIKNHRKYTLSFLISLSGISNNYIVIEKRLVEVKQLQNKYIKTLVGIMLNPTLECSSALFWLEYTRYHIEPASDFGKLQLQRAIKTESLIKINFQTLILRQNKRP